MRLDFCKDIFEAPFTSCRFGWQEVSLYNLRLIEKFDYFHIL